MPTTIQDWADVGQDHVAEQWERDVLAIALSQLQSADLPQWLAESEA